MEVNRSLTHSAAAAKPSIAFRIASEEWEFEQIHKLNYKTFVDEIPQHQPNIHQSLVDKFHSENTYLICVRGRQLVGMAAVRSRRPFSLDEKLQDLDRYLPPHRSICEIRLLAIEKHYRNPHVFRGMMLLLAQYGESRGYDLAVMSGTVRQLKLYRHLGFVPFGPLVGSLEARYQPMYLTLSAYKELKKSSKAFRTSGPLAPGVPAPINFLPGPVAIGESVRNSFGQVPVSHRSKAFMEIFADTRRRLCEFTGSKSVQIFTGSGTLANDVVAGQLSLTQMPGLLLSNGEFGNRLMDHAGRFGLPHHVLQAEWGDPFNADEIQRMLDQHAGIGWLWTVHCETSTGVLNNIALLRKLSDARGILLCLDCTSSLGTVPIDLSGIYLASGVSGKGLGSLPGLSMVFYNHTISSAPRGLPRYLDLGLYAASDGVPFTISSNLVCALHTALEHRESAHFDELAALSSWLRSALTEAGLRLIGRAGHTSPAVITIEIPRTQSSESVGDQLQNAGYLLSYRSEYLLKRNWIQICLMGECRRETLSPLLELLARICVPAS